jgi:hypothetical protein
MAVHLNATRHTALGFLLGALLVGGALGFTADRMIGDRACRHWRDPREMRAMFFNELNLSSSQRVAVDSIIRAKHRAAAGILKPIQSRLDSLNNAAALQIKSQLDPRQQATFDRMDAEIRRAKKPPN